MCIFLACSLEDPEAPGMAHGTQTAEMIDSFFQAGPLTFPDFQTFQSVPAFGASRTTVNVND
jgi:hypothetical protein